MDYRPEIDGLRALAVLPVILFHAGFETFSGGFVGVDVFFVISGYLITTIILKELEQGDFSIARFYERRARRILPALFLVMFVCIPFAWLWLLPDDMQRFSQSLVAVSTFVSNLLFWQESGYFDTAAELKPLLHTWSLAVEEQYYVLFPLFLVLVWPFGKRWILVLLALGAVLSLSLAEWGSFRRPAATFYLLPTRGWELLLGALIAFYLSKDNRLKAAGVTGEIAGALGLVLILYPIFTFDKQTPFPGLYALVPTFGAALVILFSTQQTLIGKIVGNKLFVSIGLISYSAYLWHQPILAFARHRVSVDLKVGLVWALIALTFVLAVLSWKFVELPLRSRGRFSRKTILVLSVISASFFIMFGTYGNYTSGFKERFASLTPPERWGQIKCHGKVAISRYDDPLSECLGQGGDVGQIFLIGDSHAAQLTFPLGALAAERGTQLNFINTESKTDFPYSFWSYEGISDDRILERILKVGKKDDIVVVAFHRGQLNDKRDDHIPTAEAVGNSKKTELFMKNMTHYLPRFVDAGFKVYFVKDGPLLPRISSIEKCALYSMRFHSDFCSVSFLQDTHTRRRQSDLFDELAALYPDRVFAIDILPALYAGKPTFNPISPDGAYRMFDRHHLTSKGAMELLPYFKNILR